MKNKKIIIIVCILIFCSIISLVGFVLHKNAKLANQYYEIINRIDSKETFDFVLLRNMDGEKEAIDYYKEVYGLKFELLDIDLANDKCRELINKLDSNINANDKASFYVVVEEGQIPTFLMGYFSEESLREYFLNYNIIDKKYVDIDAYANDATFNNYFMSDKEHFVLFTYYDDSDLNAYRKILKDNDIPSFILFPNYSDQNETQQTIEKLLGLKENEDIRLPVLLKVKSGKVLSIEKTITVNNFLDNIKK